MKAFKTLKEFFIKNKWSYVLGLVWLLIIDSVQLLVPQIIRKVTDLLQTGSLTFDNLLKYSLLIFLTGLVVATGRYFWRFYIFGTSRKMEHHLRNKLFSHLLTLSPSFYHKHKTGDLMAHATNDINAVRNSMGQGIMMAVDSVFVTILTVFMMIRTTNIKFTVLSLFTLPLISFIVLKFGRIVHKRFRTVQEAFSNLTDTTQESFAGIRVIKSFVQEEPTIEKFTKINQDNLDKNLHLVKISGLTRPLIHFIASISTLIIILYGGRLVIREVISLGDFVAFNNYALMLVWPMMALGMVVNIIQRGIASMERINIILDEEPEIKESQDSIVLDNPKGKIQFENVSFKYPRSQDYVLKDINFTVEEDKTLAIVGRTGSGKTTLINLLLRLYDLDKGNILFDNMNINDIQIESLRNNIGYVPQDTFLFTTSIKENIGFTLDQPISEQAMIDAAKFSEVYDNIIDFPRKFDTVLGERGVTLSGGQKQRVSISRAIASNAPILILDDSLSSVDTETEEKILNNLNDIPEKKTTLIVSHRISTVQNADEIIVLDKGEIIERGSHDELLDVNGLYKYLHEKQLLEEKINENQVEV